jgi:hypothetical protein
MLSIELVTFGKKERGITNVKISMKPFAISPIKLKPLSASHAA